MTEARDQDPRVPPIDPLATLRAALRGRYEIERQIGQGAFATVYLARDLKHERKVAIKVLNVDPDSETGEIRFIREIRLVARLQHPNILPLHDSGHVENQLYYVMPYVPGETLRLRMHRERQLAVPAACSIAREIADALAYAHSQGIVHRDIKPENILLSGGHAIVADFGIARAIDVAGVKQLTMTGMGGPGTPAYMSPEQLLGDRPVDSRSDIYSLGCVLYEMLAGKPPFPGKDGFVKRFTEPPPHISSLRRDAPPWVDEVVGVALAKDPSDRFRTASDFVAALTPTVPATPTPARGRPARHALASPPLFEADPLEAQDLETFSGIQKPRTLTPRQRNPDSPAEPATGRSPNHPYWLRRISNHPRIVAVAVLSVLVVLLALKQSGITRLSSVFGAGAPLDSSRIVIVPLAGSAPERHRVQATDGVYAALSEWRGLTVASDQDVKEEIQDSGAPTSTRAAAALARKLGAAQFIWGRLTDGDPPHGRVELYDSSQEAPLRAVNMTGPLDAARMGQTLRELLKVPGRPGYADGGDGRTNSYPAWNAYGKGHLALHNGDLPRAEAFLRAAVAADPAYAPAHAWLAQTLAWKRPTVPHEWRDQIARAFRAESGLSDKDRLIASALSHLAEGRYPQACAAYAQMTAADSADFVGLYGLGQCHALDSLIVPSPTSPSKWRFRSRYSDAADSYMKALRVNPNAHSFFTFEQLQELLPVGSTKTRRGMNAAGERFAAFPTLTRDTVVFVPYPLLEFSRLSAAQTASSQSAALSHNLDALLDFARQWTRDAPNSSAAFLALSSVLEARGEISRSRAGGSSAIQAVRKARELAATPRDVLLATTAEAWLLFKQGEFLRARGLADSVIASVRDVTADNANEVIGLAALTGKIGLTAELARLTAYSATASSVPIPVMDAAAPFFAFAAAGICGDTTVRLERHLDDQITRYVAENDQAQLSASLKARPISMLAPCTNGTSSLRVNAPANKLLRMQQALASGDTATLRQLLRAVAHDARTQRPGDVALDFTFQVAWLKAASGDTAGAVTQLDRVLGSLSSLSAVSVREPASAAAAARAMAFRAELANARGESEEKRKWARAVLDLLSGADAPLRPFIARMRTLAASGS